MLVRSMVPLAASSLTEKSDTGFETVGAVLAAGAAVWCGAPEKLNHPVD